MSDIRNKTVTGILWVFSEQFLSKGVNIISTLLLAWFLVPEDYALVAMLAVFIALSTALVDAGLGQALIRKAEVTDLDLNTAFYTNILLSIFAYFLLYAMAPFISEFYLEPRLTKLIRIITISVFFQSFVVIPKAILSRELEFRLQLKVHLPASLLSSSIAVLLAYLNYGVWALISQVVANSVFLAIFYWSLRLWRPSFEFSIKSLRSLGSFARFIVLDSLITIPFQNMYLIILPKYFGTGPVGLYFFAEKIKQMVSGLLINAIQTATYPALSKFQKNNNQLKQGYRKILVITTFLVFPIMGFLAALAPTLFESMLPEKWLGAATYLQLMCLVAIFYPLHSINLNILKVKGRSDLVLNIGIYKKVVNISIFLYTLQYGIITVLLGQILSTIIHLLPNAYFSSTLIGYSIKEQLSDFFPNLILSGSISGLIYYAQYTLNWTPLIKLIILGFLALALYVLGAHIIKLKAYKLIKEILLNLLNKKNTLL